MKHFYLFLILCTTLLNAQNDCDNASGYLVNAYSHVKDSYEANNISHLKYYANRAMESFKLSKKHLAECGCTSALNLADKGIDLLVQVDPAETYEDGRYFVKHAKEIAKESIVELDKFTASSNKNGQLSTLQMEQEQLRQQQLALKQKEKELKQKLAEQKLKSVQLEKEKLISDYKGIMASNLKTFNAALQVCNCNHELINYTDDESVKSKSTEEIKAYYLKNIKAITTTYLDKLTSCQTE